MPKVAGWASRAALWPFERAFADEYGAGAAHWRRIPVQGFVCAVV